MKKLLILMLALCLLSFSAGCKKSDKNTEEKESSPKTEATSQDGSASEESSAPVDVSDVETSDDITDMATLEALIEEFNDPETSPERREELSILLGEYFDAMGGETITLTEEE